MGWFDVWCAGQIVYTFPDFHEAATFVKQELHCGR
jgi:hypothetical protein